MAEKDIKAYYDYVKTLAPKEASEEQRAQYASYVFKQQGLEEPTEGAFKTAKEIGGKALDYGVRALDYLGGLGRVGAASAYDRMSFLTGQDPITRPEDVQAAFEGQAPPTSEFLERAGVPETPLSEAVPGLYSETGEEWTKLQKGGIADPTLSGTLGFAGDILADPLTYVSGGASAAAKAGKPLSAIQKASRPVGSALQKTGESAYRFGLKNVDKKLATKFNSKKLSDVLLEENVTPGTVKSLEKKTKKLADKYASDREALYKRVADKGELVDMENATKDTLEYINKEIAQAPPKSDKVAKLERLKEQIKGYGEQNVPIDLASKWKTDLYNDLPASAFDELGRLTNEGKKVNKMLSQDIKDAIVKAGNRAEKGLGDEINKVNENWGAILNSQRPLRTEINKAATKNIITSVDPIVLAATGVPGLVGKKAADLAKTTAFRTGSGYGLRGLGRSKWVDPTARRALIDSQRPEEDPGYAPASAWQKAGGL